MIGTKRLHRLLDRLEKDAIALQGEALGKLENESRIRWDGMAKGAIAELFRCVHILKSTYGAEKR